MRVRRWSGRWLSLVGVLTLACDHSDPYSIRTYTVGALPAGPDVQLTYSAEQDYWPAWTEDGRAILYAFVDPEIPRHRCLGILPPAGGTRIWQLCDNRAIRNDSLSSYSAFALDTAGRLLVAEATAPNPGANPHVVLWLADTAQPFVRTPLLTLPVPAGDMTVSWLSDLVWTGPTTFLALGQVFGSERQNGHEEADTSFTDGGVIVAGVIAGGKATLTAIPGTDSASGYSLANDGNTIAFTRRHDPRIATVSRAGGVPVPPPIIRSVQDSDALITTENVGISCKGMTCVVAEDRILTVGVWDNYKFLLCNTNFCQTFGQIWMPDLGLHTLHRISLQTGADDIVASNTATYATPVISPTTSDVVVQVGGLWGHLQTRASISSDGNLHMLSGLIP